MSAGDRPHLLVVSDLQLVIDGSPARIDASGQHITVHTDQVGQLLARVIGSSLPVVDTSRRRLAGRAVDALGEAGLSINLSGPYGTVIEVDRDHRSRLGRLVLGSERVSFGSARALGHAAVGYSRASLTAQHVLVSLAGALVGALLFHARYRVRRTIQSF